MRIEHDAVDIRVSLLERLILAERSRKLPFSRIRSVNPHPSLQEMMVHWSDQSGVWLCGVSAYDGEMIPTAKHPTNTIVIEMEGKQRERIYVELDDETPVQVAERISRALHTNLERSKEESMPTMSDPTSGPEANAKQLQPLDIEIEDEDEDVQLRDPLLQGSLPPPALMRAEPAPEMKLDDDRDLTRLGGWLVALGSLGLLTGGIMLASGALPGLLAVGAGVTCALLGGVALAVVAHHQG